MNLNESLWKSVCVGLSQTFEWKIVIPQGSNLFKVGFIHFFFASSKLIFEDADHIEEINSNTY